MVKLRVSEKIGRLKLKAKINLIIISMIIPIVILTFLSLSNLVLKVNSDIDKRFEIAEKSIKRAVESLRRSKIISAKMISSDIELQNNLLNAELDIQKQKKLIDRLLNLQKSAQVEYSWIYNKNGKIIAKGHLPSDSNISDDSSNPLFREAYSGNIVYTLDYINHKDIYLKYAVPIYSNQESMKIIGVFVVADKISKDLSPVIVTRIQEISGIDLLLIAENHLISTSFGIPLIQEESQSIPFDLKTRTKIINQREYDLRPVQIWPIHYIPDFGVLIALDNSEIKSSLRNMIITLLAAFLLATALAFLISRKVSKNILSSTNAILEGTEHIKNKDFYHKVSLKGNDEFVLLAETFNSMGNELAKYSEHMEELVAKRTEELKKAFDKVQQLKVQQDGDYFLTSLLIHPLLTNQVESKCLDIHIYISQKKKFQFRSHSGEIGGDVCISNTIVLNNKRYIVFANGDAMGKSLQGAGGALVMGVVFNSFVTRTHLIKSLQETYPERWLKQCYQELQNIFTSFDGSMMISAVIGLIDEETGFLCYFNAEHPWTVLYRNEKAFFTDEELSMRKIGIEKFSDDLTIRSLILEKNDIFIVGSDGRDDILIERDKKTGKRIINDDEYQFLINVQKGKGDLQKIVEETTLKGELTDDLSLLSIHYLKDKPDTSAFTQLQEEIAQAEKLVSSNQFQEAAQVYEKILGYYPNEGIYSSLIECRKLEGNPEKEIQVIEKGLFCFPHKFDWLFRGSILHKKFKNYEKAADYGERFYFYNKLHVNNLINLADIYRLSKNSSKVLSLLKMLKLLAPDNPNYLKLLKYANNLNDSENIFL
ncbi:MAG TPA: hypothetical protein DHW82_06945 [Spirochaetia bacterium]|nr:MAG: hypothetical protein A2Y41_11840 [Spirochaetes bacterium GWB1_36_13]HCL56730.1 hypothetical protein [Spirochaetia bacterium]